MKRAPAEPGGWVYEFTGTRHVVDERVDEWLREAFADMRKGSDGDYVIRATGNRYVIAFRRDADGSIDYEVLQPVWSGGVPLVPEPKP